MRFRDVLEDYVIEEWADFYIDFLALRYELEQMNLNPERKKHFLKVRSSSFHWNDAHALQTKVRPETSLSMNAEDIEANASNHDDSPIQYPLLVRPTEKTVWERKLKENIQKVESFYQHKKHEINHFYNYFIESLKKVYQKDAFQGNHFFSELHERSEISAETISLRYGNKKIMAEIYTELLCLESFCIINVLSCNLLLKMYMSKLGSETSEEEVEEMFQISKCEFTKVNQITKFKDVITNYVATHVTKGNTLQAQEILRKGGTIKLEELARIAFFLGIVASTFFVLIVAAWIEFHTQGDVLVQIFFSSFQVYRFVFCSLLAFWYMTISRYVFQLKHLNFNFVLDIRPSNMGDIQQIIKLQTYSTFVFLVAVVLDIFFCSEVAGSGSIEAPNIIGLLLFLSALIVALLPLRSFLLDIKYALGKLILQCIGSPFTHVAFIHILAADCLTSFNKVILDIVNSFCWVYEGGWKDVTQHEDCNFNRLGTILILAFPYYIRFMQCLKRYYVTRLVFPNIFNAIKYCMSIATIIISNFSFTDYPNLLPVFYVVGFSSYLYNNYWDNYNDWGMFREKWSSDKRLLRSKLTFRPGFYYTIMILNCFLRLNSMATLMPKTAIVNWFEDPNLFLLLMQSLEITRRFLWAIVRVEYELFSNFEKLRDFWVVPNVYYLKGQRKKKLQAL